MERVMKLLQQYEQLQLHEHFQQNPTHFPESDVAMLETCLQKLEDIKKYTCAKWSDKIQEPNKIELANSIYEYKDQLPPNGSLFINFHKKEQIHRELTNIGLNNIKENKVAVLFLSGGLGSRLNLKGSKGLIQITPILKKTFFQYFVEQIQFLQSYASSIHSSDSKEGMSNNYLYAANDSYTKGISVADETKHSANAEKRNAATIYMYIMTSDRTHDEIVSYFEKNNYWGLKKENVIFFKQGNMPSTDFQYNILLSDKTSFLMSPSGNGDLFRAMHENSILEDMKKKKIKYIQILSIDNILSKIADPVLLGFCSFFKCDIVNKFVKRNQEESMGVFCVTESHSESENESRKEKESGKENAKTESFRNPLFICEYTELPSHILKNSNIYQYGNICHHLFTFDFISSVIENKWYNKMELHKVQKKKKAVLRYSLKGKQKSTRRNKCLLL